MCEDVNLKELVFKDEGEVSIDDIETLFYAFINDYLTYQYKEDGNLYLNKNGVVSREEVVYAFRDKELEFRQASLDGVSCEQDYFNSGYNQLVSSEDANFYQVYTKEDLKLGITRLELAYMLAFNENYQFANTYDVRGELLNLKMYPDIEDIELDMVNYEEVYGLLPKGTESFEGYLDNLRNGVKLLPIQLALLTHHLVEILNKRKVEVGLYPTKQVSRLEFSYLMKYLNENLCENN